MRAFKLNGKLVTVDDTLKYADFYLEDGQPTMGEVDWLSMLSDLESGKICWDEDVADTIRMISRWIHQAPRKRFYRNLKREGVMVLSTEYFFEEEGGDKFIDAFENSGHVAAAVLRAYGLEPVGPIKHDDPLTATSEEEVLSG
jgi:hypothetical protein